MSQFPDRSTVEKGPAVDQPAWPDHPTPEVTVYPDRPQTDYTGTPFGCVADSDCFGQKCCVTPWGVKLCAPTCDIK